MSKDSIDIKSVDQSLIIRKLKEDDKVIALAGNPNVGKSTVFNQLTGMKQHTGNWPGKTVANVQGYCSYGNAGYVMVDIPGCYSLIAHSAEEEVARDFLCFGKPDGVVIVCDATCLERNLGLVLQILEINSKVVVCVNLMDEAAKKRITIDLDAVSKQLGVPVIGTTARTKEGLEQIYLSLETVLQKQESKPIELVYPNYIEDAIHTLRPLLEDVLKGSFNTRWLSLRLLEVNENMMESIRNNIGEWFASNPQLIQLLEELKEKMRQLGISNKMLRDDLASIYIKKAEEICKETISYEDINYNKNDRRLDRLFTSKWTGFPIMFLALLSVFWITITGANYPSQMLSTGFGWIETQLLFLFEWMGMPVMLKDMLILGVFRVLTWVISVMLPPMAIFFPLFTLLEDFGYLPRVAFNLDRCFKRCCACGKQALTMCMGFGCNAVGIVGCRIIDSPRERLIAMITNNFVPCNGRFPQPLLG